MKIASWKPYQYFFLALAIATGMFLVWYSTSWGAGLISDTFHYVASARNLVHGKGFSIPYGDGQLEPMTKYPPMFPIVLALFELAGISALQGTRFINIFLFGVNIFLVFLCVHQLTRSYWFSLLASLLFSISFVLIEVHSWALSEGLYICLGLGTILTFARYFKERRSTWLIAGAILAASLFLTRYVGLSLVLVGITVILLGRSTARQKFMDVVLFGSIALLPVALWTLRGFLLTGTLNDRLIEFHPLTPKNYTSAIDVLFGWFLPRSFVEGNEKLLLLLTGLLLLGMLIYALRMYRGRWLAFQQDVLLKNEVVILHIVYLFMYGVMVVVSKTWIDADIGLSDRILSPMLVSLLILFAALLFYLRNKFEKARLVVILVTVGLIAYYALGTITTVQRFHQGGIGIARSGWHRSEAVQSLRGYSLFSIYTNSNSSLYLWSDRSGYNITDFELLKEKGTDKKVLLVIFRNQPPGGERLKKLIDGLELLEEDQIVSIYAFGSEQ